MRRMFVVVLSLTFLMSAVAVAEEHVGIRDIVVERVLDGVRVTIACDRPPNVSSFVAMQPTAVVLDFMQARNETGRNRIESTHYPVSAITMQSSEATSGLRVAVRLRDLVSSRVKQEGNLVVIDLGLQPLPPPAEPSPTDPFEGKAVTLLVRDAPVSHVLRMLAAQFDLNMLITQDVAQMVTVRLNDVPLREGIEALLKTAFCNMVEQDNGILMVKPRAQFLYGELEARVYELDHVEGEDAARAVEHLFSERGRVEISFRRVDDGSGSSRSALLVVTDIAEAHRRVADFLAVYDRAVAQVAIEAKFIETTRTTEDRYGIDWQIRASASTGPWDPGSDFAIPIVFDQMVLGKISLDQMNASLELLATRGQSRVLANPRTMTLSNQRATVSMGVDVPLREINKDANTGEITYTWRTRSIPIRLEVIPNVISDGRVNMYIKPSVEAITGWVGSADDQQPIVARREAETQVLVGDGEVVVIGGLVKEEETRTVGKIPLLGDIPFLGHLFKKTSVRTEQNDLMIFIIPHVIPADV